MVHGPRGSDAAVAATALVHDMLGDAEAGWSVGTFGAIAEFHHVAGDPPARPRLGANGGQVVTAGGGARVALSEAVLPVAFEALSRRPGAWTHGVVFCLPMEAARLGGRAVLTELGPDGEALRDDDRDAHLFDLGVGAPHVDFCVRTAAPGLLAALRCGSGRSLFADGNPAMAAIKAHGPHRVCLSRLARVEVYQPIPAAGPGATSPEGPHTHLLPEFLKVRRTHSANTPVPEGWVPALDLHPRNPFGDRLGRPRAFDRAAFDAFQRVLGRFAPPGYLAEQDRIRSAVRGGLGPAAYRPAETRANRRAARVALRQMLHIEPGSGAVAPWLAAFDRGTGACDAARA